MNHRLAPLVWAIGSPSSVTDVTHVDAQWCAFTGQTLQESLHNGWRERIHPDDLSQVLMTIEHASTRQESFSVEARLCRFDGVYEWFLLTGIVQSTASGSVTHGVTQYIGSAVSISGYKAGEAQFVEQSEQENWYRTAFNATDQLFTLGEILVDDAGTPVDYRFLDFNTAVERAMGINIEQTRGQTARQLTPLVDTWWIETLGRITLSGQAEHFERYLKLMSGWYLMYILPLGGYKFAMLGTDITDLREIDNTLRDREARYRALVHATSQSLYRFNADGTQVLEVSGQNTSEPVPDNEVDDSWIDYYIHPEDREITRQTWFSTMKNKTAYRMEHRMRQRDGSWCWMLTHAVPVSNTEGEIIEWIGASTDITERKRAEQHNTVLTQFAGELAAAVTSDEVCEVTARAAVAAIEGGFSGIYRLGEDGKTAERCSTSTSIQDEDYLKKYHRLTLDDSTPIAFAIRHRQVVWIESQQAYIHQYPHLEQEIRRLNIQGILCLPIFGKQGTATAGLHVKFTQSKKTTLEELNILFALAQICGQALERTELYEQAEEIAATRERHRIARELHDAVSQALFASTIISESLPRQWAADSRGMLNGLEQVASLNRAAMAEMRMLLLELRPEVIERTKLTTLLSHLIDAAAGRKNILGKLMIPDQVQPLPPEVHTALYRIAQESIHNLLKYSRASTFELTLSQEINETRLTIHDNGVGFDLAQASRSGGMGLSSMRERANALGAELTIITQPGTGTTIEVVWYQQPMVMVS